MTLAHQFAAYTAWRTLLASDIAEFQTWLTENELSDGQIDLRLGQLLERLAEDRLNVAFVAEFSRGKSELINAIFFADYGDRMLPSSIGRTTMCPTELLFDGNKPPQLELLPIQTRASNTGVGEYKRFPDQWERLREHPELIDSAVDEILRYSSPVNYFRRTATTDVELGGHRIAAGEKVTLWYPSGNRDEAEFDDPHRFDIGRTPNHHMAFGAGGPHYCLGASLAKLELKVMFEALVRRLPDVAPAGPPQRLRNNLLNSIKHLPVTFTPVEPVLGG